LLNRIILSHLCIKKLQNFKISNFYWKRMTFYFNFSSTTVSTLLILCGCMFDNDENLKSMAYGKK